MGGCGQITDTKRGIDFRETLRYLWNRVREIVKKPVYEIYARDVNGDGCDELIYG